MKKSISVLVLLIGTYFYSIAQCSMPYAGEDTVACWVTVSLNVENATTGYWTALYEGVPMSPTPTYSPNSTSTSVNIQISGYSGLYKDVVFVWTDNSGPCTDSITVRFARQAIASVGYCNMFEVCGNGYNLHSDTTGSGWAEGEWLPINNGSFDDVSLPDASFIIEDEIIFGDSAYVDIPLVWTMNNYGCITVDTIWGTFYQRPVANAGMDQEVCGNTTELGAVFDLQESPNYSPDGWWALAEAPNEEATAGFVNQNTDSTFVTINQSGDYLFVFRENNSLLPPCYDTDTVQISFQENNEILPVLPMIIDDEPITLTAMVEGGTWSGNGIIDTENGVFDPSVAGIGMHTISYFIEDFNGCNGYTETGIRVTGVNLEGYLYNDANENCIYDEGEGVPNTLVYANPGPYYALTDEDGKYRMYLNQGAYTVHANQSELYNVSCPPTGFQNVEITNINDTVENVNIGLSPAIECPVLRTEVYSFFYRPGFESVIIIGVFNDGTIPANDVYVEVELDEALTLISSEFPYSSVEGNTYTFELNIVDASTGGYFFFEVEVENNIDLLGQTCCVTSRVFPNDPCNSDFGDWDYSDIDITGECVDDLNACFNISNIAESGVGDMLAARNYRIFANDTLVFSGTYQLNGGESTDICWATNGSAIRLEADQHPEHPYSSFQEYTVEACGDENGTSYGYITTTPYADESEYIDIDCRIITGSYDPNDKIVQPSGITENNYFEGNKKLTYQIDFQNTGTDTAFTVVIVDTISAEHDMLTFQRGACSHPCELEVYDDGVLIWTFNDILLPDSTTNEAESHGFVTYTIMPVEMSEADYGTEIKNNAAIFFDNNPPIITNSTKLIYWSLPLIFTEIFSGTDMELSFDIYPNPSNQVITINTISFPANVQVFDLNGKLVKSINNYSGENIDITDLKGGIYFVKLIAGDKISVGKLVVE